MRRLTIQRRASAIEFFLASYVYFEDHEHPDLVIDNIPCRLLGKIKNGETQSFEIANGGGMLFITERFKFSHNCCTEALPIFPGEEDIFLSGIYVFNHDCSTVFRLDGVYNEVTEARRKVNEKNTRKLTITATAIGIAVGLILLFLIHTIIDALPKEPQDFSCGDLTITLNSDFEWYETDDGEEFLSDGDHSIMIKRSQTQTYGLLQYANKFCETLTLSGHYTILEPVAKENGRCSLVYQYQEDNKVYCYACYIYLNGDDIYTIFFANDPDDFSLEQYAEWEATVRFTE